MASSELFVQPPFDTRIYSRKLLSDGGLATGKVLTRGFIQWADAVPPYKGLAKLDFLFNPSVVTASYAIQTDEAAASLVFPNADDEADLNVPLQQSISMSLLFDRTYELWDKSYISRAKPQGVDVSRLGCEVDVMAMKQLVGMTAIVDGGSGNTGNTDNSGTTGATGTSPLPNAFDVMRPIRSYFHVGSLMWYGFITDWSVTYTHWSQTMVPMRCVISLNVTLQPKTVSKPTANDAKKNAPTPSPNNSKIPKKINVNPSNGGVGGR